VNYRRQPGFEDANRQAVEEMLTVTGDTRTVEELEQDIREASVEELRCWYNLAQRMRWAFGVVMDRIEDRRIEPSHE
jgi:hypothetical protein